MNRFLSRKIFLEFDNSKDMLGQQKNSKKKRRFSMPSDFQEKLRREQLHSIEMKKISFMTLLQCDESQFSDKVFIVMKYD